MDTQNNESKQQQKNPGLLVAHERMNWKVGEDVIYFTGGEEQKPVAFIKLEKYEEREGKKKPVFSSRDLNGNPISENTSNLYELKQGIKDKEIELTEAMRQQNQPQVEKSIETPAPSPANVAQTQEPESLAKNPDQEKGTELKKVRRSKTGKSKENKQTISH